MPIGAQHHHHASDGEGYYTKDVANEANLGGNVYRTPGQLLQVNVTALNFWRNSALEAYAGTTGQAVGTSTTTYLYLNAAGTLATSTSGWPSSQHVPLATVVASSTEITAINDARPAVSMGPANPRYAVASLPTTGIATGTTAFATDGRKVGEGGGAGTGTLAYYDGTAWRRVGDDTTVAA